MGDKACIRFADGQLTMNNPVDGEDQSFGFDIIFDQQSTQPQVWEAVGNPSLQKAFEGFNGTIFAYGQTGSGKTWSMTGADGDLRGVIPRLCETLFERIENDKKSQPTMQYLVTASYFEIYNEVIFDLLDKNVNGAKKNASKGLEIKEHPVLGVYVKGLQEIVVDTSQKLQGVIDQGCTGRTVASTLMNSDSSRSHSVLTITIHQKDSENEAKNIFAKMNLVDLAGSERVKSTGATGANLKEGANINKSLMELGNVINALVEQSKGKKGCFIPYRNSKLTRVLQESLGGNSVTTMLAAVSPAACNFEESISTLKYANRAKAIKVNAVKNEEASQIAKLNDEIRALKEKLVSGEGGAQHVQTNVDTSAMEEKHKMQLKELENAMRSTWEEKSRVSEQHVVDQRRQEKEQSELARRMKIQKERNWQLLEDKGDLELSIAHIKDMVSAANSAASSSRLASIAEGDGSEREALPTVDVGAVVLSWMKSLKGIIKLDQKLEEQSTIIEVYRTALLKDTGVLFNGGPANSTGTAAALGALSTPSKQFSAVSLVISPGGADSGAQTVIACDKATLGTWRQMRDKVKTTRDEVDKWMQQEEALLVALSAMYTDIDKSDDVWAQTLRGLRSADQSELQRGFKMLLRQLKKKRAANTAAVQVTYRSLCDLFKRIFSDIHELLNTLNTFVADEAAAEQEYVNSALAAMSDGSESEQQGLLVAKTLVGKCEGLCAGILQSLAELRTLETEADRYITSSSADASSQIAVLEARDGGVAAPLPYYFLESDAGPRASTHTATVDKGGGVTVTTTVTTTVAPCGVHCAGIDSRDGWYGGSPGSSSQSQDTNDGICAELVLQKPVKSLSSLTLQGGSVTSTVVTKACTSSLAAPAPVAGPTVPTPAATTLPCGLTLATCDGDNLDLTSAAIADLISWPSLIKKNEPSKFLKRPPVRFLFDLFRALHDATLASSGASQCFLSTATAQEWETGVSVDKQSKVAYMQQIIDGVTAYLNVPAVTTASAIVTGSECPLTNVLLQQIAVACVFHTTAAQEANAPAAVAPAAPETVESTVTNTDTLVDELWVTTFRLAVSADGESYQTLNTVFESNLMDADSKAEINLEGQCSSVPESLESIKYLRFYPVSWSSSGVNLPCLRLSIHGNPLSDQCDASDDSGSGLDSALGSHRGLVEGILQSLQGGVGSVIGGLDYLHKLDENKKVRKNDEIKRHMEVLANEKLQLEQKLTSDKENLTNEKQDLADQLAFVKQQLAETQVLYTREHEVKGQLETYLQQVAAEKQESLTALNEHVEENSSMRNEILRLQVLLEKSKMVTDSLESKLAEAEGQSADFAAKAENADSTVKVLEQDKEDLVDQIAVLQEEKAATREHEEELFEQLESCSADLEELQQSYVIMSDRCNDAQDEICDLREQMEGLVMRHTKAIRNMAAGSSSSSNASPVPFTSSSVASLPTQQNTSGGLSTNRSLDRMPTTSGAGEVETQTSRSAGNNAAGGISRSPRDDGDGDGDGYDDDFEVQEYEDEFEDE